MKSVAFTNDTDKTIPVGNKSVRPYETREVDPSMIPEKWKNKAHGLVDEKTKEAEQAPNPMLDILDGNVASVLLAISEKTEEGNHKYTIDNLAMLEQAEQSGNTRKGVIEGITEERLSRASQALEAESFVKELTESSDEDLTAALELYVGDDGKLALVQAEIDKRKNG